MIRSQTALLILHGTVKASKVRRRVTERKDEKKSRHKLL